MSKTQIRGPQRQGAHVLQPGDAAVVDSYAVVPTEVSQREGQAAAAAILPLRRELWRLAERLVPLRLAAALRARSAVNDPTGRDGVRELRLAIADWLDPPPCCRWCRQPMREGDEGRTCSAQRGGDPVKRAQENRLLETMVPWGKWAESVGAVERSPYARRRRWTPRPVTCRPSKARKAPGGGDARCGTLALYPAGYADLRTMAAALACPKGASRHYDVAADRDGKALLAATAALPPRDPDDAGAWRDEGLRLLHAAVQAAREADGGRPLPGVLVAARKALDAARNASVKVNGRMGVNVQLRYGAPSGGVTRADLVQGAATGLDRAAMDYDSREAKFTTYAAAWARQGVGEALSSRDLVDTPAWVLETRRKVEERLRHLGPSAARDLLLAIEAVAELSPARFVGRVSDGPSLDGREPHPLSTRVARGLVARRCATDEVGDAEASHANAPTGHASLTTREVVLVGRDGVPGHTPHGGSDPDVCQASLYTFLIDLLVGATVRENIPGTRPPRYETRILVRHEDSPGLVAALLRSARKPGHKRRKGLVGFLPTTDGPAPVVNPGGEDPERARERVAAWVAERLELGKASGPGLLAALRHGAPVFVGVGSGQDAGDDDGTQGTDGAGGQERRAAVLAAPDEQEAREAEDVARARWQAALAALATLRGESRSAAEVVRRHHGLDSVAEGTQGAGGESFAAIAEAGLASAPGKAMCKETVRKLYKRGLDALRALCEGRAPDLSEDEDGLDDPGPVIVPRSPWKPLPAPDVVTTVTAPTAQATSPDPATWLRFREAAAQVAW